MSMVFHNLQHQEEEMEKPQSTCWHQECNSQWIYVSMPIRTKKSRPWPCSMRKHMAQIHFRYKRWSKGWGVLKIWPNMRVQNTIDENETEDAGIELVKHINWTFKRKTRPLSPFNRGSNSIKYLVLHVNVNQHYYLHVREREKKRDRETETETENKERKTPNGICWYALEKLH